MILFFLYISRVYLARDVWGATMSYGHILLFIYLLFWFFTNVHVKICTVKTAHAVNSIKQSPVLKGHLFLVLA